MIPVKEALEIIRNHARSWNNPEVYNSEFDLAFESIRLKNSANRIQNINPLFERSEFGFMLPNKLNFRNLAVRRCDHSLEFFAASAVRFIFGSSQK